MPRLNLESILSFALCVYFIFYSLTRIRRDGLHNRSTLYEILLIAVFGLAAILCLLGVIR
jgi:EamA domain-containing membrane protein RarD